MTMLMRMAKKYRSIIHICFLYEVQILCDKINYIQEQDLAKLETHLREIERARSKFDVCCSRNWYNGTKMP